MAEERHRDKHGNRPRIPSDLWVSLGEKVGDRERTRTVVALVRHFLGEGPMPPRPWVAQKAAKSDRAT